MFTLRTLHFSRLGKLDQQSLRLYLDARDVGIDQAPIVGRRQGFQMLPNRPDDQRLDVGRGYPAY